ncbi:hypothetical protein KORDIASMS9_01853 [Kordia sp. SMS9]|uniref:hypothetical protein n=1 Tax=Kordia sp. SMS9 TaxID=2282170 RepID=UPI000E0DDEF6|nr:hypothetical protein [Kordia sp. SMS9]AXG69628.1 hypothetical protein KORDIASMS9_01853 [Kordia sp. SMS9]
MDISNNKNEIKSVFLAKGKEVNIYAVDESVEWKRILSIFNDKETFQDIDNESMLIYLKFLTAYYNSSAYKTLSKYDDGSIEDFYSFIKNSPKKSRIFRGFIFDAYLARDISADIDEIKEVNNFIIKNNLLDEILLEGKLLEKEEFDYSRADTTNRYLGII